MSKATIQVEQEDQTSEINGVPLLDLNAQHAALREELRVAIDRVMETQQFILGSDVRLLEEEIAAYIGVKQAIACASGSDALILALQALDIGVGDEVITSPYTFFSTAGSIVRLSARPVFVDIEPATFNINTQLIEAAITPRTKAIMPVHIFGQCAEMQIITEISTQHRLPVIEDAAQAIGAEENGKRAGSFGAVGCFSFYPTKNLGGAGDGGMLVTNDNDLAERLRILRVHGGATEYHHKIVGINSRLDTLQAAILRVKLPHLDGWSDERLKRAENYQRLFASGFAGTQKIVCPVVRAGARHIFHQYIIRVDATKRDSLINHLKSKNIGVKIYYPIPLHLQECFHFLGYKEGDLPESERAARETIALPIYPELTQGQQEYVVQTIRDYFADDIL
ncbi:MAG: DegT/DnrJ/EryC1/StrS family aminotransferase [Pyrinomonadaceae bacterium]